MRVFVGYGYNERDAWIHADVLPILRCIGFTVLDGKDAYGEELPPTVADRIEKSDAAIGFFTIREGQVRADYSSHIWVRDEMLYAKAKGKPLILVKEEGVNVPDGLFGNIAYIILKQSERLGCVKELLLALGRRKLKRVRLAPVTDQLRTQLYGLRNSKSFSLRYRTQTIDGIESSYHTGRLELVDQAFYMNLIDVPDKAMVELEGQVNGEVRFSSGWVTADAIHVPVHEG